MDVSGRDTYDLGPIDVPPDDPGGGGGDGGPADPPRPAPWWPPHWQIAGMIALAAAGVATERLTLVAVLAAPGPAVIAASSLAFLAVPTIAVVFGVRAYNRSLARDEAIRAEWRRRP